MYTMDAVEFNEKVMKGHFRKIYPEIARQVINRTGVITGRCIDLGGGPGMLGISIAKITMLRVTVVDLMQECVELVRQNSLEEGYGHRVDAMQGVAEELPFEDRSIDLVVSRGSIFFWENQQQGLAEVFRVLRPGGWAFIGGGFGTLELLREVEQLRANDPEWSRKRKERMTKNPPEHYRALLKRLGITGTVEHEEAGTWIIFSKPEEVKP
ncbi:MAG: class I SAM-dependent methyltransferase [Chlorobiaceae bacterium]|nr:class I SAM-dependent methyltransferase [Chlorobiaceae bacterium]